MRKYLTLLGQTKSFLEICTKLHVIYTIISTVVEMTTCRLGVYEYTLFEKWRCQNVSLPITDMFVVDHK